MKEKISKKQLLLALTAVCLVGLIGVGISYAYYVANFQIKNPENGNNNVTSASTTNVVMDIKSKTVAFDGVLPGHKEVKAFTIRGEGDKNAQPTEASIKVMPNLGVFSNDVTWKLYKSAEEVTCTSTQKHENSQYYEESSCNIPSSATLELSGGAEEDFKNIIVYPKTEAKYYLVVEYANQGDQNIQQGQEYTINLDLAGKQLSTADIIAQLDTTGKCPTVNADGSMTKPAGESTSGYLCSAPDAYGTSYYYRGTVDNNYVLFANKYWRIVRVNGDGSMRIIYDGTVAHANGDASADRYIGTTAFNSSYDDNKYVGYMYGNFDGVKEAAVPYSTSNLYNTNTYYVSKEYIHDKNTKKFRLKNPIAVLGRDLSNDYVGYYTSLDTSTPSTYDMLYKITSVTTGETNAVVKYDGVYNVTTTKEQAQTNINDSTIKKYLDNWYERNIKSTEYEQYLADNLFCNDRSITSGTGAGKDYTEYRWYNSSKTLLTCPQKNDAFTVSDTTNGNGSLKYPIGLLTADEFMLAGGSWSSNSNFYLYTGNDEWLLSPYCAGGSIAHGRYQSNRGNLLNGSVQYRDGARAVLNLKPGLLFQGAGTMEDPYKLSVQ